MASQEDTMRLVAELLDKTSGPLKDIQKSLRDTAAVAKKMTGEGTQGVKEHDKAYQSLHSSVEKTRRELSGAFTPAMAALGLTTFGAGEAIGKVVEQLKRFAEQYTVLRDASRRSGQSVDFLESMANTMERLTGEAPEEAIQNIANMKEQMDRLSRQRPDTINAWKTAYTGLYETLGKDLMGKTLEQQIDLAMKWKDAHPEIAIDKIRDVFRLMGMDQRLATVSLKEWHDAEEKEQAWQKSHPYDAKTAEALHEAFDNLREVIRTIGYEINQAFGGRGATLIESLSKSIEQDVKDIKALIETVDKMGRHLGFRDDSDAQKQFDEEQKKLKNYIPPHGAGPGSGPSVPRGGVFPGGSYHPAAFTTGGGDAENVLTRSIKEGMLSAFREWFSSVQSGGGSGGGGGFTNAAFSPSGDKIDSSPIGQAIRQQAGGGAASTAGGGHRALAKALGIDRAGGGGRAPGGGGPTGVSPSENNDASLAGGGGGIDRDKWLAHLNANPALKESLFRHSLGENSNPMANQAVMEEAANRADLRGNKRFDEHGNLSYFKGYYKGAISPKQRAMLDANFDKVFRQGSDVSKGAVDNSSQGLAYTNQYGGAMGGYGWAGKKPGRFRTTANFGGDGITGHRGVESFEAPGWGESGGGERDRYPAFRQHQLEVAAQRRDLLANANKAGMTGGGPQKVEGDAHLKVDLNGFPKGTKTDLTYGGLFTQYTLAKGQQMEAAESK
jgi:hypothetical protein